MHRVARTRARDRRREVGALEVKRMFSCFLRHSGAQHDVPRVRPEATQLSVSSRWPLRYEIRLVVLLGPRRLDTPGRLL